MNTIISKKTKLFLSIITIFILYAFNVNAKEYKRILRFFPKPLLPADTFIDEVAAHLWIQLGEALVRFDTDEIVPGIASNWHISKDLKTYDFDLNPEFKFSDGESILPEDVIKTIEVILKTSSKRQLEIIKGAKDFRQGKTSEVSGLLKTGTYSMRIILDSPYSPLLQLLTIYPIVSRKMFSTSLTIPIKPFPSSGAYSIYKVVEGENIILKKNIYHPSGKKAYFDTVIYDIVTDEKKALKGLFNNTYHDIWPYEPDMIPKNLESKFKKIPLITAYSWFISLNLKTSLLKSFEFRKYFSANMDIDAFLKVKEFPSYYKATGYIPRGILGYRPQVEKIKSLLSPDRILKDLGCKESKPCQLNITISPKHQAAISALIRPLQNSSNLIRFNLYVLPVEKLVENFLNGNYESMFIGANAEFPDAYTYLEYLLNEKFHPGVNTNEIKTLLEKAVSTNDRQERSRYYSQIDSIITDNIYLIPIYHGDLPTRTFNTNIKGFRPSIIGFTFLRISELSEEK